jgi:hypothetical protein
MEYATGVGGAKNLEIPEQHILKYGSRVGKIWKLKIKLQIKRSEKRYKFSIVYCFFSDLTLCISLSYDNSDQNKNEANWSKFTILIAQLGNILHNLRIALRIIAYLSLLPILNYAFAYEPDIASKTTTNFCRQQQYQGWTRTQDDTKSCMINIEQLSCIFQAFHSLFH